jgi:hypothetical protein
MIHTFFPIYQCKICAQRLKRVDIPTKNGTCLEAIEALQKRIPQIAHLNCKLKGIYGVCELIGVFTVKGI